MQGGLVALLVAARLGIRCYAPPETRTALAFPKLELPILLMLFEAAMQVTAPVSHLSLPPFPI